jgi:predicted transcriptional regulator
MTGPALARELPPRLELECLKALWILGQASVRDVQDAMQPNRQLAYTTVMTVMDRLARRGCVRRHKAGRSFVYIPVLTQEQVRRLAVNDLVDSLFDGSEKALQDFLFDTPAAAVAIAAD